MPVLTLVDLSNKVNIIYPNFDQELGLSIRPIDVSVQKIDGSTLNTYWMVVAAFLMTNKANRVKFFEKTFLVPNVSLEIVFGMPFLTLSGANVDFLDWEFH